MSSSIFRAIRQTCRASSGIIRRNLSTAAAAPWLMLPPTYLGEGTMEYNFYSPRKMGIESFNNRGGKEEVELMQDKRSRLVGCSHGWLALFNECSGDLFISNPVSGRRIKLPSVSGGGRPRKVIMSCSPDREEESGSSCHALMIYGPHDRLASCYPGRSSEWSRIGAPTHNCGRPRYYADCVYSTHRQRFLCVLADQDSVGGQDLECWDVSGSSPRIDWKNASVDCYNKLDWYNKNSTISMFYTMFQLGWHNTEMRYLVYCEQSNKLYLVTRTLDLGMRTRELGEASELFDVATDVDEESQLDILYPRTKGFDVHKIRASGRSTHMTDSLDGLVMFVGSNHSLAVPASEHPHLKPNSIYFANATSTLPNCYTFAGFDIGVFDYQTKELDSFSIAHDTTKIVHPTPTWYTPTPTAGPAVLDFVI